MVDPSAYDPSGLTAWDREMVVSRIILIILLKLLCVLFAADSLGGDLFWSAGLSLITDIPQKPHWPVKLHGFLNAGRLDALDKSKTVQETLIANLSKPSVSAGVGIVYKLDPMRVELNFGVPLVASKGDGTRKGLQFGIGLDFL